MVEYGFYGILKEASYFTFFENETFCLTFCQKASAAEAEAEGKKASAFGRSFGLRSTPDLNIIRGEMAIPW